MAVLLTVASTEISEFGFIPPNKAGQSLSIVLWNLHSTSTIEHMLVMLSIPKAISVHHQDVGLSARQLSLLLVLDKTASLL